MDGDNEELTELKKLISSLLISSPLAINIFNLDRDYSDQIGKKIPFRKFGYFSLESFLRSMPDVVQVQGSGTNAIVKVLVSEKVAHIDNLVAHQKLPDKKPSCFGKRPKQSSRRHNHAHSSFIPRYTTSQLPSLPRIPQSTPLPSSNKLQSTSQSTSNPPLLSLNINPSDRLVEPFSNILRNENYTVIDDNDVFSSDEVDLTNYNFPYAVQDNLKLMTDQYDDYNVPYAVPVYSIAKPLLLNYDKGLKVSELVESTVSIPQIQASAEAALPEDLSYLSLASNAYALFEHIPKEFIPDDIIVGDYVEVGVAEIYDPSKFWIILKSQYDNLKELTVNMQIFYTNCDEKLHIPENRLECGLYCAAKYNEEFHRAIIVDTNPNKHEVKVFYIDYGSVSSIKSAGLYFLHQNFVYLMQQAIRARLASIYPVETNTQWDVKASTRFLNLVKMKDLVARIYKIDYEDEIVEVILVDTNGDDDIYINDTLVDERYALFMNQEQKEVQLHPECIPCVKFIHLYPTFDEIEQAFVPSIIDTQLRLKTGLSLYYCYQHYFVPLNKGEVSTTADSRKITSTPANSPTVENEAKFQNEALSKNHHSQSLTRARSNGIEESNNKDDTLLKEPIRRQCCYLVDRDTDVLENSALNQNHLSKPPPGFEKYTPVSPVFVNLHPFVIQTQSIQYRVQQPAVMNGFPNANMASLQHINAVQQPCSLLPSTNYYVNQNFVNPFGVSQTQTSPDFSKLCLCRQIMVHSLIERHPLVMTFIEDILTNRGNVAQKQIFYAFKQNYTNLDAVGIEIFLNSVLSILHQNDIMELFRVILQRVQSKKSDTKFIIQGELNGHVICYIRYENKVYVLVDELCELMNVKIPVERMSQLMVFNDLQYRIIDIGLNDNKTLKEEISRFRNLDSTSNIHIISLECISKMVDILTDGEVRLNNFDSIIFKYHSNSDVWTKN